MTATIQQPGRQRRAAQSNRGGRGEAHWQDRDELRWAVRHWASRIGVAPPRIHIRPMRTKWASISTAGRLTLDESLLRLPRDLGEYVIVHELVHRLVPNHGRVFKSFMFAFLPEWEQRDLRLRNVAHRFQ